MLLSESYADANVLVIMFNIMKILVDKILKGIWLSKKVWTFEKVFQQLKEVCMKDKENLMISFNGNDDND